MIELSEKTFDNQIAEALGRLITAEHFRGGSIISMPVTYPSGASVALEITRQKGRWFVSDRGGGSVEADMSGTSRYYKAEAGRVVDMAGVRFDGWDIFVDEVSDDALAGAMVVVANCSSEATKVAALRAADRNRRDAHEDLYIRLSDIYKTKDVQKDAEAIGSSNHKWRVSVQVSDNYQRAFFEPVSNFYVSIVGTAAKFHDFANMDDPPARFSVIKSRQDLGDFFGVVAAASTKVITETAPDSDFLRLLNAA